MQKNLFQCARKKSVHSALILFLIISPFAFSDDIGQSINLAVGEALRERPAGNIKTVLALQNPANGAFRAELLSVRINGKLLESGSTGYIYRAQKQEPSRILWLEVSIQKKGGQPSIIQGRKELSKKNLGEEIFVKILIDYSAQKINFIE